MTETRPATSAHGGTPPGELWAAVALVRLAIPYALFSMLKHVVAVDTLARWAWKDGQATNQPAVERLVLQVDRLRRFRGNVHGDCLESALLLYRELSRNGVDPRLVMGFARDNAHVVGHAWVEVNGVALGETSDDVRRFTPAVTFGTRGQRVV